MTEGDKETLKVRLVDAALKGRRFRFTNTRGVASLYMLDDKSFWIVTKHPHGMKDHVDYSTHEIRLADALDMIDAFWTKMTVDRRALEELDHWLPNRRNFHSEQG